MRTHSQRSRLAVATLSILGGAALLVGPTAGVGAAAGDGPITGSVYRDLEGNGVRNGTDPGQEGVTVTVTDAAGASATATSGATGAYSVNVAGIGSGPFRVEFTGWPGYLQPAPHGTGNPSSVSKAAAGSVVDFGVWDPSDFCQANPTMAITCFVSGEAEASLQTVASFPYNAGTTEKSDHYGTGPAGWNTPDETKIAGLGETGSVYGQGWHARSGTLYMASFAKRFVPFGAAGSDVIYSKRGATFGTFFDGGSATNRTVPGDNWYLDAWKDEIGKVGYGDIDVIGNRLYAVNLETRQLQVFDLNPITGAIVGAGPVASVAIPAIAENPADSRPFGLGVNDGVLFVGGVDSGQAGGTPPAAWVQSFNPLTNAFTGTVTSFSLGFERGCSYVFITPFGRCSSGFTANWRSWGGPASFTETPNFSGFLDVNSVTRFEINPQPMLSDIAFDDDGDMVLGFRDRHGDQAGRLIPAGTTANPIFPAGPQVPLLLDSYSFGDTLRLDRTGASAWALESNGTSGGVTGSNGSLQGPGGGEFYDADGSLYVLESGTLEGHDEVTMGGLYAHRGTGEVASTAYDVFGKWDTLGVRWMSNAGNDAPLGPQSTDLNHRAYGLYTSTPGSPVPFGKANGLGDLEALCGSAPIELGNLVWLDSDNDGIQDPNEPAIPGVTVRLVNAGATVATAVTDASGRYWFVGAGAPNLPPAPGPEVGVVPGGIAFDTAYTITFDASTANVTGLGVASAAGLTLTTANSGANDAIDSDPTLVGAVGSISLTTGGPGANNHTFDAGYNGVIVSGTTTVPGPTTTLPSTTQVTILGSTTVPRPPVNTGQPLAATGSPARDGALVGLGLLLVGLGLMVSSRRPAYVRR